MSINIEATIRWKGYNPNDLSPKSNKRVWANCEKCGRGKWVTYDNYHDLCRSCTVIKRYEDPKEHKKTSKAMKKYFDNPLAHKKVSKANKKRFEDPKEREKLSKAQNKRFEDPLEREKISKSVKKSEIHKINVKKRWENLSERKKQSEIIKNSKIHQKAHQKQVGGQDIVNHHMIYDHSDLTKNIMSMTRSVHMKLHRLFQKHNIEIPHINMKEVI